MILRIGLLLCAFVVLFSPKRVHRGIQSTGKAPVDFGVIAMNQKVSESLRRNFDLKVVYQDILGEGRDGWDLDPLYPDQVVNCIVWIRKVVAEAIGETGIEKRRVMDELRYYYGQRGFSLRKHFTARWMKLDPGPFQRVDRNCVYSKKRFELDLDRFTESLQYGCDLYEEDENRFLIQYLNPKNFLNCAADLNTGWYFLFGVPSEKYNKIFGKKSGPMALVHGMILEADLENRLWIYHASTDSGKVEKEPLQNYVDRMAYRRHIGYQIYSLDPYWQPKKRLPSSVKDQVRELLACERELPIKRQNQSF